MATPTYDWLRQVMQQKTLRDQNGPASGLPGSDYDTYNAPQRGLLGRLIALQAEQNRYQPNVSSAEPALFEARDPNFRQLSRVPVANWTEDATGISNQRKDLSSPSYGQPVISDVTPDPVRPGAQYAQAPTLFAPGQAGYAFDGNPMQRPDALMQPISPDMPLDLIGILGAAALLGGATIFQNRKKTSTGGNDESTAPASRPRPEDPDYEGWVGQTAKTKARVKATERPRAGNRNNDDDFCENRKTEELRKCEAYRKDIAHPDHYSGCQDRATIRWDLCNRNYKRRRKWDEPAEWDPPEDEEIWFNTGR